MILTNSQGEQAKPIENEIISRGQSNKGDRTEIQIPKPTESIEPEFFDIALLKSEPAPAPAGHVEILTDSGCYDANGLIGYVLAGSNAKQIGTTETGIVIEHPRFDMPCTITLASLLPEPPIPDWIIENLIFYEKYVIDSALVVDIEPVILFAVMGKESHGEQFVISSDGYASIGLMQIIPSDVGCRSWDLTWPRFNIFCGSLILREIVDQIQIDINNDYIAPNGYKPENAIRAALAAYNCGYASLYSTNGKVCINGGGLDYADDILNKWVPAIKQFAGTHDLYIPTLRDLSFQTLND